MAEMVLSDKKKQAIELNEQIIFKAQLAQKNLYDMCVMLKQMRDEKLYRELGHATFEEYCENEIGMSRYMAYKYTNALEIKNVESIQHLGITKLSLLASLSESQQEEIQQNVNLEETSVRQLKAEIERLKEQSKKNERELSEENHELNCRCNSLVAEMNQLKDDNDKIRSAKISMESDLLSVKSNNRSLRHQLDDAEKKIADLESRPVEVAIQEDEEGKIAKALVKQLDRQLSEADQNHVNEVQKIRREYQNQINELEEQLTEITKKTTKVVEIDAIFSPCVNNLSTAMDMLIDILEKINDPSAIKEARKKINDYRWKMDDIFDIFYDKYGHYNI